MSSSMLKERGFEDSEGNYYSSYPNTSMLTKDRPIYEGLDDSMWSDPNLTSDHPALLGIHGWLPPQPNIPSFSPASLNLTYAKVLSTWNISDSYGWDFPLLAMTAARAVGDTDGA
ncbi:hypothetical protein M422DRAFT_263274, partial [Sphaerobolus stellatus SS14]